MTYSHLAVLLTGSKTTLKNLNSLFKKENIKTIEFPTIEIKDIFTESLVKETCLKLGKFDWIFFTSQNGVSIFFSHICPTLIKDYNIKIAAIGDSTKNHLESLSLKAQFIPSKFNSTSFCLEFNRKRDLKNKCVLLPTSTLAGDEIKNGLKVENLDLTRINIYETKSKNISIDNKKKIYNLIKDGKISHIVFTSSSSAQKFFSVFSQEDKVINSQTFISIGPKTTKTLERYKIKKVFEPEESSSNGILDQILTFIK